MTWARVCLGRLPAGRLSLDGLLAVGLAGGLIALGFLTTGGFDQAVTVSAANTWSEIAITLLGATAVTGLLVLGRRGRSWGAVTVALFLALTVLTALSISWSVQPDDSWQAANLTLAYLMAFSAGAALGRLAPQRWRALCAGIAIFTVALAAYGLVTKVFPGSLAATDTQGRLQAPLGYWNATGAMAALGLAPVLWLYGRRDLNPALRGLAVPSAAVLVSVLVLSYSRTALVAAVLMLAAWFVLTPGRLRTVPMVILAGLGAGVICAWALSHAALTSDGATLAARTGAGHSFGRVLLVTILLLTVGGIVLAVLADRVVLEPRRRRRLGAGLLILLALLPVAGVVALASSARGLTGEISYAWSSLTSVNSSVSNSAARITQFGSSRPLYWSEGITVGEHALFKGVGALGYATARTRFTSNTHIAGHAHSYVVQTFADLGLLGLAVNLALAVAWLTSAGRALAPRRRWSVLPLTLIEERRGLLALYILVIGYGLVSAVDWTWFFPAVTVPALLAAGWLTGRGPLAAPLGRAPERASILSRPVALAGVSAVSLLALACAWLIWQPLRSADAASAALTAGTRATAFTDARSAAAEDPLALQPLFVLAALDATNGDPAGARRELVDAVNLQPQNHDSWLALGLFDLKNGRPRQALAELKNSYQLDRTVAATAQGLADAEHEQAARRR